MSKIRQQLEKTSPTNSNQLITKERKRDWSFGPITGHRFWVILSIATSMAVIYILQETLLPTSHRPQTNLEHVWSWVSYVWVAPLVFGTCGLIGIFMFKHPKDLDKVEPIKSLVCWRIVSRGINVEALTNTIRRCQMEMSKTPLFPYIIEVVTDTKGIKLESPNHDVRFISVPKEYQTPKGTLYKGRALNYASENSPLPPQAWIVHLDEETQPTSSGIKGICAMIGQEDKSEKPKIGQGAILYHRNWQKYPFLTLADNIRTGTDFAQFHLQHRLGITLFGFHGSYIVVRNDVEKSIGFDFGPNGSITEDAFWGLVAMERGFRCRWTEGYLEEQSTQSIMDFLRQRRRWIQGLNKVYMHAPVKLKWRLSLGFNTIVWLIGPFATMYTFTSFFYGFQHEWWVKFLSNLSFAIFQTIYLVGLKANLDEHRIGEWYKRALWYIGQFLMYPIFSIMESAAVVMATRKTYGFHVVKK